ncbi:MAG TPA: hypothetical protein VHR88_03995 [Solirubrobacteraceae bacterium]|nr:hypothetical protein [Solirubrobacteraceae bacterium]
MTARLRVYRFDPGFVMEGGLVAAAERMQLLGQSKLVDALFVGREPADGALQAVDLGSASADTSFASLLDFRLDPQRRRALTERTLADHPGSLPGTVIEELGAALEPGCALLAVLHTGPDPAVLDEAVTRAGGRRVADEPTDAAALSELGPRLREAAGAA